MSRRRRASTSSSDDYFIPSGIIRYREEPGPEEVESFNLTYSDSLSNISKYINLKVLECRKCRLTNLSGLESCVNLEKLTVVKCGLTLLKGIENCVNLKELIFFLLVSKLILFFIIFILVIF
jgi:hypothetical protein